MFNSWNYIVKKNRETLDLAVAVLRIFKNDTNLEQNIF